MKIREEFFKSVPFALRVLWVALILGPLSWIIIRTSSVAGVTSSEAASWVQAVGSIGAIIGAAAVALWQMNNSRKQSGADKLEKQLAMYAVIHTAAEWAVSAGKFVGKAPPDWAFRASWMNSLGPAFSASLQIISKVPAHELGSPQLVTQFVTIIGGMETIDRTVNNYLSEKPSMDRTSKFYREIQGQANVIESGWGKFVADSGYKDFRL